MRFSHTLHTIMSDGDYKQSMAYHIWQRWGSLWLRMNCFPWEILSPSCMHTWHCDGSTHFLSTSSKTCPKGPKQTECVNESELEVYEVNVLVSMCELALPGGQTAWHPSTHVTGQLRVSGCWQVGGQALPQALYFHSHSTPASLFNSSQLSAASKQSVTTHCSTKWLTVHRIILPLGIEGLV